MVHDPTGFYACVGFSACLAGLRVSTEPWVLIVGLLFITSQWALLYRMLLAFPSGGLGAALEGLAHRGPLPVELEGSPGARLPERLEAAAY
jgi:hypothetical protein